MMTKLFLNCKTSLLAASVCTAIYGAPVLSAEPVNEKEQEIEIIQVSGIRGSLKESINTKRFSAAVVDAVSAEDVGKFPDSDVGETLGRIAGVTVNRQFGQGQQVSIRGASSNLTQTLLDGHSVASTGWYTQQSIDRSFNYSLMPPELVGGIEVYKSSQADLPEGGIGGTIIVKTRKPLDLDSGTAFASAKADYGTVSEETDPQLSGLYSWKNENETFGVLVSGSVAETNYQRNGVESLIGFGEVVPARYQQERERTALNTTFQYRPNDQLEFGLSLMSLELEANNINSSVFLMFPDDLGSICEQSNASGTCTFYRRQGTADENPALLSTWAREASMSSDTVDLDFTYEHDNYTLEGRVGRTEAKGGTDLTSAYGVSLGTAADFAGTYDATGDIIAIDIANKSFDESDLQGDMGPAGWSLRKQPNSDEETYFSLDLSAEVDLGAISQIKTGVRWTDHNVKQESFGSTKVTDMPSGPASKYFSGSVSAGGGFSIPQGNLDAMLSDARAAIVSFDYDSDRYRGGYGTVAEENLSLYVMADFEGEGVRGNFGFRYISTDAESDFYNLSDGTYASSLSTDKANYNDVLPSVNIAFDLAEDVILRMSAAQVITRPNYADMFSASKFTGYEDGLSGNETVTKGNVGLDPFKATQADLSFEWYFSDDGMFSAGYFFKDVSSFVTSGQKLNQQIGVVIPETGLDDWTVSTTLNATGGEIQGIELQLQDAFDNGYGYSVNYTFADADSPAENYPDLMSVFSDSSEHTFNLVGYYENETFNARLAYNWRSEYMMREAPGHYGNREHQAYGSLDFSANYALTDNLDLTFEAVNLTKEDSIQIGVAPAEAEIKPELKNGYPAWYFEGEARYKVGVAVRF